ncbi:MAG TPA: class I SAM-dependent methyltransferase [Steroidobacteraceae bacterium]|nr:class I SAM-dependent methyltransferase [Steroidobacteraceae bacterium]
MAASARTRFLPLLRPFVKGALTFIPGANAILPKPNAGHRPPSTYFYGVWLKHLSFLLDQGFPLPTSVAELGPGDSLGLGICALLCGADRYVGLDIFRHTAVRDNVKVLHELATLFRSCAPRPTKGWPDFDGLLDPRLFLKGVQPAVTDELVQSIERALLHEEADGLTCAYKVPWYRPDTIEPSSVDLAISHAVLEHVKDIRETYAALHVWLKPGGVMSHQIDFRSHNLTPEWNGYRAIPESVWRVMMGRRPYLINREPWSAHARAITDAGFKIINFRLLLREDGIERDECAGRWKDISEEDLTCAEAFVQAQKI